MLDQPGFPPWARPALHQSGAEGPEANCNFICSAEERTDLNGMRLKHIVRFEDRLRVEPYLCERCQALQVEQNLAAGRGLSCNEFSAIPPVPGVTIERSAKIPMPCPAQSLRHCPGNWRIGYPLQCRPVELRRAIEGAGFSRANRPCSECP